jgi:catechol 2,3-dioxygenase-like lactoylglutathione lyase family enzyme
MTSHTDSAPTAAPVSALVPMLHVADVERSVEFYRLLGFEVGNYVPPIGIKEWVWLYAPRVADWKRGPNLMLTRSRCAIDGQAQEALFYFYARDLGSLHSTLVANGVAATEITYPEYLPAGEFRIEDPDGYTLMIAQSAADTP